MNRAPLALKCILYEGSGGMHILNVIWTSVHAWVEANPATTAILGTILGAILSALFDLRGKSIGITKKIKNSFKQGDHGTQVPITDSPGAAPVIAGRDVDDRSVSQALHVGVLHGDVNMGQGLVGTEEDALARPAIDTTTTDPALTAEQQFFCEEVESLCERNGGAFASRPDYVRGEGLRRTAGRQAAVCYVRVFNPLATILENAGDEANGAAIKREIKKLEVWLTDNHNAETVDAIVSNIERVLYPLFTSRNTI